MPKVKETKYLYLCDNCEAWYDRDEEWTEPCSCGHPVRLCTADERHYFYWRVAESGYKIIPLKGEPVVAEG